MGAGNQVDIDITVSVNLLLRDDDLAGVAVLGVGDWMVHDAD